MLLRFVDISFEDCRRLLEELRLINVQTCHEWVDTIIDEDDLCVLLRDKRGFHKHISFYDDYPDIEKEAKAFVMEKAISKKRSSVELF